MEALTKAEKRILGDTPAGTTLRAESWRYAGTSSGVRKVNSLYALVRKGRAKLVHEDSWAEVAHRGYHQTVRRVVVVEVL
jgi:hypothetical protein